MAKLSRCLAPLAAAAAVASIPSPAESATAADLAAADLAASPPRAHRRAADASSLLDAVQHRVESTESDFDHMLDLLPGGSAGASLRLTFHWNDPSKNAFEGRLVHRAPSAEDDAGWLGFGIYDVGEKGVPESVKDLMVGSQAIIGNVKKRDVAKFTLGAKELGPGGVERMAGSFQSLIPTKTSIAQHEGDDGHVTTILSFKKMMKEADDAEIVVRGEGHNAFLYAVGPPADGEGDEALGFHVSKGAFLLDFDKVSKKAKGWLGDDDDAGGDAAGEAAGSESAGDDGGDAAADAESESEPGLHHLCQSDDPSYIHMIQLTDSLRFHYSLDVWSDTIPPSLIVRLTYDGHAWLGLGVSPDGNMIGSEAVIGRPDLASANEEPPLKYRLEAKGVEAVVPMVEAMQTLKDASIVQKDGKTVMSYTKILSEEGEITIEPMGTMTFIYAVGASDTLSYHKHKGSFKLDLSKCASPTAKGDADASNVGAGASSTKATGHLTNRAMWISHGALASVAWAIAAPSAVTTASFRTMIPSSWIYVHVFANISTFFLTALAAVLACAAISMGSGSSAHFSDPHHIAGLVILVMVTVQVANGFLRPPVEKQDPYLAAQDEVGPCGFPRTPRDLWKLGHRLNGAALLCLGFWQITTGLDLYAAGFGGSSWKPYFYFYLIAFGVVVAVLRVWMWWEERSAARMVDSGMDPREGNDLVPDQGQYA